MPAGHPTDPKLAARAIGLSMTVGQRKAAKATGVKQQTISRLERSPKYAGMKEKVREEFVAELWDSVQEGLVILRAGMHSEKATLRDRAQAWAILVDRYALLNGEATARTEVRDLEPITVTDPDAKRARDAYLTVVLGRPLSVGSGAGTGTAPGGDQTVPALLLPGEVAGGQELEKVDPEGAPDGDQPDGGDRG